MVFMSVLLLTCRALAQQGSASIQKGHYEEIEVTRFEVDGGIDFPPAYMKSITEEKMARLRQSKRFTRVVREGERPANGDAPAIKLVGRITSFRPGSRALRYFVGMGAGMTRIVAHIQFFDRTTGTILY